MSAEQYAKALGWCYRTFNRRELVHPDPLEFVYLYDDPADREIVGLVAATLAYGRVEQILVSVRRALDRMGPRPARFLRDVPPRRLEQTLAGFKHRFSTDAELAAMLAGARAIIRRHGTLAARFAHALSPGDQTVLPALRAFRYELARLCPRTSLLPDPSRPSACKRLHLYLRWMVRRDEVDPGCWPGVPPQLLIVPIDTHMLKIGRALGLTDRRSADLRTALQITDGFRRISPDDPVRYDFCLTRLGINPQAHPCEFLARM